MQTGNTFSPDTLNDVPSLRGPFFGGCSGPPSGFRQAAEATARTRTRYHTRNAVHDPRTSDIYTVLFRRWHRIAKNGRCSPTRIQPLRKPTKCDYLQLHPDLSIRVGTAPVQSIQHGEALESPAAVLAEVCLESFSLPFFSFGELSLFSWAVL